MIYPLVFSKIADTLEAHEVHFHINQTDIAGACCAPQGTICAWILFFFE
jgi:hypothetical protein